MVAATVGAEHGLHGLGQKGSTSCSRQGGCVCVGVCQREAVRLQGSCRVFTGFS